MAADAVYLATLVAQNKRFQAPDVPSQIILHATTVTKDNVDQYMKLGF
jgi:ABC-type sugar transport system substrate-binding protein